MKKFLIFVAALIALNSAMQSSPVQNWIEDTFTVKTSDNYQH